ncbi:alpha/beta hydrolase [Maribacter polysaccharolyticus]|uniref:alpha/beta hydrolase n=1 Tax=Maribacter polysaccharolyticus TaxID=3020831 RepID=UPI00237F5350|nr:alpha/beta hydrolase family protein [Maribacter polysaccharolyticus]MDE3741926.1 alpha/beta hydrolase family protein [Maribacter polysaccharolyticus]
MKYTLLSICLLILPLSLFAANVDTLVVYSKSMKKNTKTCVITPDNYKKTGESYPVLYLLHGYSGNYASWVKDFPQLKHFSDRYNLIIVGVDGDFSSWYFDSPVDSTMRYETYVTKELIDFIDNRYNSIKSREGRAVTGLSMGGHGALYLAIRHQDIFGASGSMSGGVDIRPFPQNWDLAKRLGDKATHPENWEKHTVINQLYLLEDDRLALIIDCGIDDFFIDVNRHLHEKLLYFNIPHDYIERPGGHTLAYWDNALQYQILYFDNFFRTNNSKKAVHTK